MDGMTELRINQTIMQLQDFVSRVTALRVVVQETEYRMECDRRRWALDILSGRDPAMAERLFGPGYEDDGDCSVDGHEGPLPDDGPPDDPFGDVYIQLGDEWVPDIPFLDFIMGD